MRRNILILIFSAALGAAIFSSARFLKVAYEKSRLESQVYKLNQEVNSLQEQLAELNEKNSALSGSVKKAESRIDSLSLRNTKLQDNIFILIKEVQSVHKDKLSIKKEKNQIDEELTLLKEKNEELQARLHSIPELKKAIKELKIRRSKFRLKAADTKKENSILSYDGNGGFIIKDGISTYKSQVKIVVEPVR